MMVPQMEVLQSSTTRFIMIKVLEISFSLNQVLLQNSTQQAFPLQQILFTLSKSPQGIQ
jgi:hypothetical protein